MINSENSHDSLINLNHDSNFSSSALLSSNEINNKNHIKTNHNNIISGFNEGDDEVHLF